MRNVDVGGLTFLFYSFNVILYKSDTHFDELYQNYELTINDTLRTLESVIIGVNIVTTMI